MSNSAINDLLRRVSEGEELIFADVIAVIDTAYTYQPAAFRNGCIVNAAGQNQGSCKILAFASLHDLGVPQTLALFGEHYRHVLQDPDGSNHANIRAFMNTGWVGIAFEMFPLAKPGTV